MGSCKNDFLKSPKPSVGQCSQCWTRDSRIQSYSSLSLRVTVVQGCDKLMGKFTSPSSAPVPPLAHHLLLTFFKTASCWPFVQSLGVSMGLSSSTLTQLPQGLTGWPRALSWASLWLCRLWESVFRFVVTVQNSCGRIAAQGGQKSWQYYLKSTRTGKWWDGKLVLFKSHLVNIERQPGGLLTSSTGNLMHLYICIDV